MECSCQGSQEHPKTVKRLVSQEHTPKSMLRCWVTAGGKDLPEDSFNDAIFVAENFAARRHPTGRNAMQ